MFADVAVRNDSAVVATPAGAWNIKTNDDISRIVADLDVTNVAAAVVTSVGACNKEFHNDVAAVLAQNYTLEKIN